MNFNLALAGVAVITLTSCATVRELTGYEDEQKAAAEAAAGVAEVKVKPEIDFSDETPDCVTAAERIAANIEAGMTLYDVTRLVGKPRWKIPGSWWWSASFNETGVPIVKFQFGAGLGHTKVKSVVTDSDACSD